MAMTVHVASGNAGGMYSAGPRCWECRRNESDPGIDMSVMETMNSWAYALSWLSFWIYVVAMGLYEWERKRQ